MSDLTARITKYRECLKDIWNQYFAAEGDWDARVFFSNAAVELFRGMVLFDFEDPNRELLPSYRGDQRAIHSIRVHSSPPWDDVKVSIEGTFRDTTTPRAGIVFDEIELAYVDLWDMYPLGHRNFEYVCAEVVASSGELQAGTRVLVPFARATFERAE
jgi:hypothetical protein